VATILATQVEATEVAIRGHVGYGIVSALEEAKSSSVLELLQQWSRTMTVVSRDHPQQSLAFVNSTDKFVITGSADTSTQNINLKGKQPEIIRHWGFSHEHPFWGSPMLTAILHYLSFAVIIKAACMFSNVMFQVSPLPMVKQFQMKHDTGDSDAAPFVAIAFGGLQWCFYGAFAYLVTGKSGFLVLVYSNCLGGLLGIYYVYVFQVNCSRLSQISGLSLYFKIVSMLVIMQIGAMAVLPRERALFFSGLVSSTCSVVTSLSALTTLPLVIKRKCAASIPLPLCMASAVSGVLWIICGVILWDPWIAFPNIIGVTGSSVCIGLCFYYGTEEKDGIEDADVQEGISTPSWQGSSPGLRERTTLMTHGASSAHDDAQGHSSDQEWGDVANYGACGETGGTF
jgi:solute carrier family 50 protein (sugar transporter)